MAADSDVGVLVVANVQLAPFADPVTLGNLVIGASRRAAQLVGNCSHGEVPEPLQQRRPLRDGFCLLLGKRFARCQPPNAVCRIHQSPRLAALATVWIGYDSLASAPNNPLRTLR
jgi:hypothetical protein